MSVAYPSATPSKSPRRLFSAKVERKFFIVSAPLSEPEAPMVLLSSVTIDFLSASDNEGAERIAWSLVSFFKVAEAESRILETGSRTSDLAAAVY